MAPEDKPPNEVGKRHKLKRKLALIGVLCLTPVVLVCMILVIVYFFGEAWYVGIPYIEYKIAERKVVRSEQACIQPVGNLNIPRNAHKAILLKDGNVLISGGIRTGGSDIRALTAELYNPKTKSFEQVGSLRYSYPFERTWSFLLPSGLVLIVQNIHKDFVPFEVYDSDKKHFLPNGGLSHPIKPGLLKDYRNATLLHDGHILFFGFEKKLKIDSPQRQELLAELYDPKLGEFQYIGGTGLMIDYRDSMVQALTLKNGQVLLTTSTYFRTAHTSEDFYETALYNPKSNLLERLKTPTPLGTNRGTLLQDGDVLYISEMYQQPSVFLLDLQKKKFITLKKLSRGESVGDNAILPSGKVILIGSEKYLKEPRGVWSPFQHGYVEIYDPRIREVQRICELQHYPIGSRLTVLQNGDVLVTGGGYWDVYGAKVHSAKSFLIEASKF